jgi:hypothetical protein
MVEKIAAGELLEISNSDRVCLPSPHLTMRARGRLDSHRQIGLFRGFGLCPSPRPSSRRYSGKPRRGLRTPLGVRKASMMSEASGDAYIMKMFRRAEVIAPYIKINCPRRMISSL